MDIIDALHFFLFIIMNPSLPAAASTDRQQADGIKCKKRSLLIAVGR